MNDLAPLEYMDPKWNAAGDRDWRNHIGRQTRKIWQTFTPDQRRALMDDAEERTLDGAWE